MTYQCSSNVETAEVFHLYVTVPKLWASVFLQSSKTPKPSSLRFDYLNCDGQIICATCKCAESSGLVTLGEVGCLSFAEGALWTFSVPVFYFLHH